MPDGALRHLLRRLRLYLAMLRYGNAHNRDFAREHAAFFREMEARLRPHLGALSGLRVLDVGCGKSFWLTLLLHSAGACVTGIDIEAVRPGKRIDKYIAIWRQNGLERALRTLTWDLLYARPYYRELAAACSLPLRFQGVDVRSMNVTALDFPSHTFDLVVSHEVFEHLPDLPAALRCLRRVMKPDGLTYIYVHSFTSLSGGHHIAWKYPDTEPSTLVPPWDHLRENRFPEIPSWVNRLRERDYRHAFEEGFEVVEWFPTATEGVALLTSEIRAELAEYSEEELLTKGFVIIARPVASMDRHARAVATPADTNGTTTVRERTPCGQGRPRSQATASGPFTNQ